MARCRMRCSVRPLYKYLVTGILIFAGYQLLWQMFAITTLLTDPDQNISAQIVKLSSRDLTEIKEERRTKSPPPKKKPVVSTDCEFESTAQEGYILNAARRSRNNHFLYIRNCSGCVLENSAQSGYTLNNSGFITTAGQCFDSCDVNVQCRGATLDILGGCFYHSAIVPGARLTKAGFTLYIKNCKVCELANTAQRGYNLHDRGFPSTKEACYGTCDQNTQCHGATIDINSVCWLHFEIVRAARWRATGHFLYLKNCNDCELESDAKEAYELKGTAFCSTKSKCFGACDQNQQCMGATWDINNLCWPHSKIVPAARRKKNEHTLYIKHCKAEGDWTFTRKVHCPNITMIPNRHPRKKLVIDCKNNVGSLQYTTAYNSKDVFSLPFKSQCLSAAIEKNCLDNRTVPNIVHYGFFKNPEFNYPCFLSFMSAIKFIKPCMLVIHGEAVPHGPYWDHIVAVFPNIILMNRTTPETVGPYKLAYTTHASDLIRIEAVLNFGGIYLDGDEVVLRSVDKLRDYSHTQGHESDNYLTSAFMLGEKNNTFLRIWYGTYFTDYRNSWAYNAMFLPAKLAKKYHWTLHSVGGKFTDPGPETGLSYKRNFNWAKNYGMHIYRYAYDGVLTNDIIRTLNTTIGSVARHILFGNKELCIK